MDRRRFLAATALGLSGVGAGCSALDSTADGPGTTDTAETDGERSTATDAAGPSPVAAPEPTATETPTVARREYERCPQFGGTAPRPPAFPDATPVEYETKRFSIGAGRDRTYPDDVEWGPIDVFETGEEAQRILSFDVVDEDRRPGVREFVAETDFETAALLYANAHGPHLRYTDLHVTSLGLRESTLVGAVVMPTPCFYGDQMESKVSILARFHSEVDVDRARIAIVNGRGCVGRFAVDADEPDLEVLQNFEC